MTVNILRRDENANRFLQVVVVTERRGNVLQQQAANVSLKSW